MKQKGFTPILVLILIALAVAGYFGYKNYLPKLKTLITPTPTAGQTPNDNLANWKTYTDLQNKFTFAYPPYLSTTQYQEWMYDAVKISFIQESVNSKTPTNTPQAKTKINTDNAKGNQTLFSVIKITDTNTDAQKYVNDIYAQEITDKLSIVNISPVKTTSISNKKVYYYEKTNSGIIKEMFLDLDDNTILRIDIYDGTGSFTRGQTDSLINQILSTFKFLDQSNTEGKFCGGIAANLPENQCPDGFYCKLDGKYPDAGGICTKN